MAKGDQKFLFEINLSTVDQCETSDLETIKGVSRPSLSSDPKFRINLNVSEYRVLRFELDVPI